MTIQALSHPLWFPMLCLAFTPILAFVLIGWEVKGKKTGTYFSVTVFGNQDVSINISWVIPKENC